MSTMPRTRSECATPTGSQKIELMRLPNEVLLDVLLYLRAQDLFKLAILCRRLHHLSLPLYFSQHSLPENPTELHDDTISALPGLRVSLFTTTLECVSVRLENKRLDSIFQFTRQLKGLFLTLEHVETVKFNVPILDGWWRDPDCWRECFGGLLEAVAGRCRNLTVDGDLTLRGPVHFSTMMLLRYLLSYRKFSLPKKHSFHKAIPGRRLSLFDIRSHTLLRPHFLPWTLQTINTSPITSLSFSTLTILPFEWTMLLRAIELPSLCHFSITTLQIYLNDVWKFTARHPSITSLALQLPSYYNSKPRCISKKCLPNLETLSISTCIAESCLSHRSSYPRLVHISLVTSISYRGSSQITQLVSALGLIARRESPIHLRLDLYGTGGYKLIEGQVDSTTSGNKNTPRRVLTCVTHLEIRAPIVAPHKLTAPLPIWLAHYFPAARVLSIEAPRIDDNMTRTAFLCAIQALAPQVEYIKMNDRERRVADWLDKLDATPVLAR